MWVPLNMPDVGWETTERETGEVLSAQRAPPLPAWLPHSPGACSSVPPYRGASTVHPGTLPRQLRWPPDWVRWPFWSLVKLPEEPAGHQVHKGPWQPCSQCPAPSPRWEGPSRLASAPRALPSLNPPTASCQVSSGLQSGTSSPADHPASDPSN